MRQGAALAQNGADASMTDLLDVRVTRRRFGVAAGCALGSIAFGDGFGEDVAFLNRALESVFARLAVDPARVAIGGFSDGATYALSLGLANGDLFPRVVAFSPGFIISAPPHGRPRFFLSHGISDQ